MKINDIKSKFHEGTYTKPHFLDLMFEKHKVLFEYSEELNNTGIAQINISDEGVEFVTREHNLKFLCPTLDRGIAPVGMFNLGTYEKEEIDMCLSLIRQGDNIFDVGANVGWFSLIIAKNKQDVSLFSFEPIPATFKCFETNLNKNDINTVSRYNFGFYSENTSLTFFYDSECSGKTSAVNLAEKEVNEIVCELKTLDTFVSSEKIEKIDFIKCDVEGAEYFVFQGGYESLCKFKPIIFSEMLRKWSAKFDYHPNDIIQYLGKIGYLCFTVQGDKLKSFVEMNEDTLETNFIFLHTEKHAHLIETRVTSN